jgi:hypothetical protein
MDREELYRLYVKDDLPMREIAAHFGCDRTLIAYYARKFGFPKRRNKSQTIRQSGDVVGDWTIESYVKKDRKGYWVCRCKCGESKEIEVSSLNRGGSSSCRVCAMRKTRDERIVPAHYWLKLTVNAARRAIPVSVSHEDVESLLSDQKHLCALTGWTIGFGRGRTKDGKHSDGETTASLDRIDSSKPYEVGNIQWVHKDVQNMKQSFTEERLKVLCRAILTHAKEGDNVRSPEIPEVKDVR